MAQGNIVLIAFYDLDSMSVRTLHAVLQRAGYPVHSVFFKSYNSHGLETATEQEIESLIGMVKDLKPAMVGLSVRSSYYHLAAHISARIRKEMDCLLVWGGSHAFADPRGSLNCADAVCVGEGEEAMLELAGRIQAGQPIDGIRNLWLKRDGAIIEQEMRPLIADLDTLPFVEYYSNENMHYTEQGKILPMPGVEERETHWIMTARGCPYSCTYCCNNTLSQLYKGKGKYVRRRSVESVMEELHLAKERFPKLNHVSFWDDVFSIDPRWMEQFYTRYRDEIGIPFFCFCHPKATDDRMIQLLREAGLMKVDMGIQSGSERTRREIYKRHEKNSDIIRAASTLVKYGIECYYDLIMENPAENDDDKRKTLELVLQLPHPFELRTQSLSHFPGTESTQALLEQGLIKPEDVEGVKQTSFDRWAQTLDETRAPDNLFWDNLYYMASQPIFPKGLIVWLSHSRFVRKHPRVLTFVLKITSNHSQTIRRDSKFDQFRLATVNRCIAGTRWLKEKSRPFRHVIGLKRSNFARQSANKGE